MKDFQFVIQNFLKDHEKHKKYLALLTVLSIVVSFAVPLSLIMPAVSMNGELICGMEEHIHSDECYELSCGLEESEEHIHNADCYTLVCDTPEHIHSQECYSYEEENYAENLNQSASDNLVCGMEEHTHSDECYELTCGLEESEEHMHNADCYTLVCDIPEHIHSQECYSYEEEFYEEENNFNFENLSPDAINISNVKDNDEQGRTLVSNMNGGVDGNNGYSKGQLSEVALLIGDGVEWAANCKNADEVIEAAKRKYFLGIASDFCVFLEGDFNPTDSDTEGRVAVGGNVDFDGQYNYQIGAGDYSTMTALKNTDNYINVDNFAHLIVGGSIKNLSTLSSTDKSSGWGNRSDSGSLVQTDNTVYYPVSEDLYKRFVIGASTDINSCSHITWLKSNNWQATETLYNNSCSHDSFNPNEIAQFYQDDLIDFTETFNWLRQQSEKLSKKTATGTTDFINGVLTLDGSGVSSDTKTVYFTLDDKLPDGWNKNISKIEFTNVPENANLVVNYGGENIIIDYDDNKIETWINGEQISNTGTKASNNNKKSEQILYNFYNATNVFIDANFNGTILAPNADVTSEEGCNGHLSGSLIAKSFEGGLEFGYRPYRGGMEDILGSSMGYTIPVDKFIEVDEPKPRLEGAKFEIIDSDNKVVNSFTSRNDDTNYVDIPSKIDFTGGETYTSGQQFTGEYTIKEVSAPEGYIVDTETTRKVTIIEEIQGLMTTDSGTIPTHIIATVTFDDDNNKSFTIDLKDTYSFDGSSSKQIRRELKINGETFYLEINNGKVSEVSKNDGNPTDTGTIVVTDNKQHATDVLTSEISSYVVTTKNENGEDVPVTVTSMIDVFDNEAEGLTAYKINKIGFDGNVSGGYDVTFYYSDKTSVLYHGNSSSHDGYNTVIDLGSLNKDNVVGISIKFNNNTNGKFFIQETSNNYATIFGTDYNTSQTFEAGKTYYFPKSATKRESTTVTSTETTLVYSSSTLYYTTTVTAQYDKYATIIADPSIAQIYPTTTVDSKYYYNPDNIMMMPMPSDNLEFENRCGLLFKKVDSTGKPLSGATIKLQYQNGENYADVADTVWNWTGSSFTIDPVNLDSTKVYRFYEESAPAGYETAPEIYFKKISDTKIRYASSEDDLNDSTKYTTLDLMTDRTITMTDTKITGAKLKLKKTNEDGTKPLNGAKFRLYSADGENGTLVYPLAAAPNDSFEVSGTSGTGENVVVTGEIDLYQLLKEAGDNVNSTYVQNGYLKEGLYYLDEVSAPTGYQAGQKFYFTINKNNGVYDVVTGKPNYLTKENHTYKSNDELYYGNEYSGVAISKIEIDVENVRNSTGIQFKPTGDNTVLQKDGLTNGTFTIDLASEGKSLSFGDGGRMKITFWNCDITDIRYYIDSSSSGGSSGGGSSTTDFGEGITFINTGNNRSIVLDSTGLSRAVTDDMITNDSVVMTITFNTSSEQKDWGNAKFVGTLTDGTVYTQKENSYLPTGCHSSEYQGNYNISFKAEVATISLTVSDIRKILGVDDFSKISSFGISYWNSTTISDVSFTNITASTDPDTPTGGEGGNTSNNTEEGAIDKDTTVTEVGYIGLIAKNSPMGNKTSITVKKNWVDDTDYKTLRPANIQVQLYRSTNPNLKPDDLTDEMKSGDPVTITPGTDGKWEHTWTNLDTKDSSNQNYYYYVKEVAVPKNYNASYDKNGANSVDITIKNTLKTVDISVNKEWVIPEGVTKPESVTVKLQTSSDGASWTDTGKTMTLESPYWTGTFDKLLAGKYYKVVETNIPTGWTVNYSIDGKKFDKSEAITITNTLSVASLNIKKYWENDTTTDKRPDINISIYRSTTPPSGSVTSDSVQPISLIAPDANGYNDYSRLLQYSLYFYDANMCGNYVGESSDLKWRDDCHTDDAVLGGYHDAGDHVMFGLPQGYTASTLGWSYYENKAIYDGLGQTEHYRKIMKRFCDFFLASSNETENGHIKRLLYQKGNADTDHSYWGSPEQQPSRANEMSYVSYGEQKGSDIAAEYAAALALYYLNFPDSQESADYLERAKLLYEFSIHNSGATPVSGYDSKTYLDDQAWAAGWLYLATQKQGNAVDTYKDFCLSNSETINDWTYCWDDVSLGAACLNAYINNDWSKVNSFLTNSLGVTSTSAGYWVKNNWGSARYNTAIQMIALIASKRSDADYSEWCKSQMSFLLGDNPISKCFVTGFADNSVQYPHHRAASGYESSDDVKNKKQTVYDTDGHVLIGALVGGPSSADCSAYSDSMQDYNQNEVALDYNATLVGAAAALFDVYGTGTLVTDASQIGTKGEVEKVYSQPNPVLTVYGKSTMYKGKTQTLTVKNANGTVTWSSSDTNILTVDESTGVVTAVINGKATITATDSSDNSTATFEITVTSSAITPDIPTDAKLVNTITLTSSENWKETLLDLPITDGQGNTYYYYIAEVDDNNRIIGTTGASLSGYIPVDYDNGKALSETYNTELSVTNMKTDVDDVSMPSTGGTGTQPYKVIGFAVAGGALIMLGIRRRKKHC